MNMIKVKRCVGKYELGKTIGKGAFAKVRFARNSETGEHVAIKILDKEKVLKHKLIEQIEHEIASMKLRNHPNVIRLHEVMGSKTKIFLILEFVTGGYLLDKTAEHGRMKEEKAWIYFHQLINVADYCHSPPRSKKNLLLDAAGNLKVYDFGLSALSDQSKILVAYETGTLLPTSPVVSDTVSDTLVHWNLPETGQPMNLPETLGCIGTPVVSHINRFLE